MSVYRPAGSDTFVYDFQHRGHRFYGSTRCKGRREAEAFERRRREEAKDEVRVAEAAKGKLQSASMTLDLACDMYWVEVGQFHPRPDQTEWSLAYLIKHLGKDTPIKEIGDKQVAQLVARRRTEFVINRAAERVTKHERRAKERKPPKRLSPATVNRSVTEPLRKVLKRAKKVWKEPVQEIEWGEHLLAEPQERIRALSVDEEARLFAALNPRHADVVRFALRLGLRLSECVNLKWDAIDWGSRTIMVLGKGAKLAPVPMPKGVRDHLWGLQGRHAERVFSWMPAATSREPRPTWRPFTANGLDTALGRALQRAGIADFHFHDLRHTAATRMLRKSGNLKAVSRLLRHTEIKTTMRYAHVLDDDVRDILESMEDAQSPVENPVDQVSKTENKEKSKG